jgi:hypothetical protein
MWLIAILTSKLLKIPYVSYAKPVTGNYMKMQERTSVIDSQGKILFFGLKHFMTEIANGDCCFICGAKPEDKEFNNEHVIPDWILKKFNLYSATITLPNGTQIPYGKYKVPCCVECNTELGNYYEKPISELLSKPYAAIAKILKENKGHLQLLFKWISLIYIKTHLKDKYLQFNRDTRTESKSISSLYYWEEMHHVHCVARSHYTRAKIEGNVYGTMMILPAINLEGDDSFDYIDNQTGKGVLLKLGDFCIVAVLNDACAGFTLFKERLEKINGPLNPFQLREVVAHMNFISINLKKRPSFYSNFENGEYKIIAEIPEYVELLDEEERIVTLGQIIRFYVSEMIGDIENREKFLKEIEDEKRNYLFDEKGNFINFKDQI